MTRCIADHPLPYGRTACPEHATSLVDGVPVCADFALDFGIAGRRLTQLTPETAKAALGALFADMLPTEDDEDDCGIVL